MKPIKFKHSNAIFGEDQPQYLPLPAFKDESGDVVTCWNLSFVERIRLLFTGRLWLITCTHGHALQPILPTTENPIKEILWTEEP